MPTSCRRGSGFSSTGLKPHRRRSATSLFLDCTMPVLRCVRLSGIRGLAKVPFLALCVPVHEQRCGLAETWCRAACAPQLGSPICHNYCSKSLVRSLRFFICIERLPSCIQLRLRSVLPVPTPVRAVQKAEFSASWCCRRRRYFATYGL